MGFQPWYAHCTYPAIQIPLFVESVADNFSSGGLNVPIGNFSMVLRNVGVTPNIDTTGTGTFLYVTQNPAVVTYQFSDADTTAGTTMNLIIEVVVPGVGTGRIVYDPVPFTFTAS